jgi:hypothetical protein
LREIEGNDTGAEPYSNATNGFPKKKKREIDFIG